MKLSVVILNYNVRHFLELCLQSVIAATQHLSAEIIVVDNNSPDDSCQMVKANYPEVILIENKENVGFSKGNNIGVSVANGQYVCILNPDTVVPEDAFTKLLAEADGIKNLGILGCQLIDGSGQFLPESKRNIPTPKVALQKIVGNSTSYYSNIAKDKNGKVDILVGAFMLLKTKVYKDVGGFDEDYFMYGEDIDLSYKILKKGYKNYYCGDVSIIHFKGESTIRDKTYAKRFYGAMQLFYKKHFKKNIIMNALVYFGIKMASLLGNKTKSSSKKFESINVISDRNIDILRSKFCQSMTLKNNLKSVENNTVIIMDAEKLSYSEIINFIKTNAGNQKLVFRIWLKNSNFILGSDSNIGRGEIIKV